MPDPGDRMAARYRELARDEPPPALDAAILAASRRAVGSRPGGAARWAGPVSIAAVLVLGLSISLRMQVEQPGIETSSARMEPAVREQPSAATPPPAVSAPTEAPRADANVASGTDPAKKHEREVAPLQAQRRATPAPVPAAPIAKPAARDEFAPAPPREAAARPGLAKEAVRPPAPMADAAPAARDPLPGPADNRVAAASVAAPAPMASAPIAASAASASPPPAPAAPAPRGFAPEPGASPQDSAAPQAPRPAAPAAMRAATAERREATSQGAVGAQPPILDAEAAKRASPEAQLERIARLREAKRDEEADRALEEFRRSHPDYRIPAALWERVRNR